MDAANPIFANWYFHLPNYLLAALMYSVLGRLILTFFFGPESRNYIFRAFVRLTDPFVRLTALVTPLAVPHPVTLVFTFFWLGIARFALMLSLLGAGFSPSAS